MLGGLESPNVASQVTRFQRARRPSTCIFAAQCTLGLWTCSFLTAWRAARSRGLSRRHPQHLASRFLHVQRAPTARQRSTPALAVRLPAVGMAAVCGRSRNLPSPPKGQPPLPPCDSTSLRTLPEYSSSGLMWTPDSGAGRSFRRTRTSFIAMEARLLHETNAGDLHLGRWRRATTRDAALHNDSTT